MDWERHPYQLLQKFFHSFLHSFFLLVIQHYSLSPFCKNSNVHYCFTLCVRFLLPTGLLLLVLPVPPAKPLPAFFLSAEGALVALVVLPLCVRFFLPPKGLLVFLPEAPPAKTLPVFFILSAGGALVALAVTAASPLLSASLPGLPLTPVLLRKNLTGTPHRSNSSLREFTRNLL